MTEVMFDGIAVVIQPMKVKEPSPMNTGISTVAIILLILINC